MIKQKNNISRQPAPLPGPERAHTVLYYSYPRLVAVFLAVPGIIMYTFIQSMLSAPPVPDTALYLLIILMLAFAILLTVFILKRWGILPASVLVSEEGLIISLQRRSPLYGMVGVTVPYNYISNLEEGYTNSTWYLSVRLRKATGSFYLAAEGNGEGFASLLTAVATASEKYNSSAAQSGSPVITFDAWYTSGAARAIAWAVLLLLAALPLLPLFTPYTGAFKFWKVLQLYVIGIPFIVRVFAATKVK